MLTIRHRPNYTTVRLHDLTVYFSYTTPVVFHTPETGYVCRVNDWGPTTGRHMSYALPTGHAGQRPAGRIPGADFLRLLEKAYELAARQYVNSIDAAAAPQGPTQDAAETDARVRLTTPNPRYVIVGDEGDFQVLDLRTVRLSKRHFGSADAALAWVAAR